MDDSGSSAGGEGIAAGKSAYAGVSGSSPTFAPPSTSRLGDYVEIFSDVADSCSIPFLDLPPALDGCDVAPIRARGAGFDYSEVFGGLDSGETAASYEEPLAGPKREEEPCSSSGRTTEEATCSQQVAEASKFSPTHSHEDRMACQEVDRFSSNSSPSDIATTQFNVSYNKTSQGSKEGAMGGETHITQLHAVPAFTFVVDANTFQTIVDDGHPNMLNGGIDNGKHRNKFPATSSRESPKSTENYLRAGQKHSANKYPVPENGRANASHDSCSSSSSILSGDVLSSDTMYLAVSDISLRTQAVRVPPPSRPPPRLFDKQGHPKLRILSSLKIGLDEVSLSKPIANSKDFHARQEVVKDSSPSFSDVQVDVGSDAAACAAAIKEAMELAEAKLKSAKELMKKKSDSLQNRKKLGQHESIKHKEQKLGQASLGQESFDEMLGASEKRNNVTSAAKLTPHYKKKEKVVVLTDKDGQTRQGNDLKSSKLLSKLSDKSEKWKTNKNYHGLANSEKYKMIEEVSEREDSMNKTKIMTMISEFKQSESTNDSLAFEIESNRTVKKNNVGLVACVCEENANPEAHDSHVEEVVKPGEVHRAIEGEKAPLFAGNEKKMEPLDHCKLHYTHDDNVENSKFETAVEACEGEKSFNFVEINESNEEKGKSEAAKPQGEDYEKEINIANVAPEPCKIEEKLNVASATAAKEQREIQVACRSCISKGEGMEAAWKCIDSEKTRREEMQCDAENVNQVEGAMSVHEQEKREEMHMKQQSCISAENELRVRENQEADKLKEDLRKWKSTVRATTLEEQEKLVKETDTAYWQACNGNKAKEAQLELQQRDEKEDATPEPYNLEIFEEQNNYEKGLQVCGNEGIRQIQVEPHFMDKIMSMHAVPVICKRPHNMTLDIQPVNRTEKGGNISYLSLVAMESHPVASKENIPDIKKTEEKEKEIMEKEREQMGKLARRLQEEKEMERTQEEKEKTRLLEEANKTERKSIEEKERERLWKEAKDRERKSEEEKEQARLLEEAKERERKLEEEKERERLLEEEKEKERKLKEEKEQARLLEEAKGRERKLEEEKEQARLLEEAKEREKKLEEEKERARLLEEAKEGGKKLEEEKERTRLLEEAKEMGRKLEEEERARLLEEAKERERRVEEEEGARLIEEAKERERKLEEEKERARLLEEEKERVREGEKDRLAVEKTVRIAVERVISEARQRAFKEAQEKAEKASCEALEKSLTEKAPREARLRADHAAVEHASAEVRGRAVERALAEKAAADAREHAERYNASSRDGTRKENVTEEQLMARDKDGPHDAKFQSTASSSSYQANSDSNDQPDNSFGEGESALGCKAILERHQRITERAALALAEMNMRDILVQREQAERNRLAEHLEADLKRWSNGKKGNLRALLSTLQYILGPESGWQPIPLTDVITTSAIKKAYRKATLCVHPDKLQQRGASIQQKYICEKVFDLLKEAWNRFKSEERLQL